MGDPGFSYTPSATSQPVVVEQKSRVLQALKGSASWFVMIAGLSVVNSILAMSGMHLLIKPVPPVTCST